MCYTGCPYEYGSGECAINYDKTSPEREFLRTKIQPHCLGESPLEKYLSERESIMKILNKNHKMKHSKMLIDEDTYEKICNKYGTTLKEHLAEIEKCTLNEEYVPEMRDVSIMMDVYIYITKIVRKRG